MREHRNMGTQRYGSIRYRNIDTLDTWVVSTLQIYWHNNGHKAIKDNDVAKHSLPFHEQSLLS